MASNEEMQEADELLFADLRRRARHEAMHRIVEARTRFTTSPCAAYAVLLVEELMKHLYMFDGPDAVLPIVNELGYLNDWLKTQIK